MTAKRFMVDDCGTLIDMTNRNTYDYVSEVCDLLNEQHEEIGRLKQKMEKVYNSLIEENEQLKSKYSEQCIQLDFLKDENQHMRDLVNENEQLKKALWCIRKRYGYTIEEFIEDLKDNGIDLSKVDLE